MPEAAVDVPVSTPVGPIQIRTMPRFDLAGTEIRATDGQRTASMLLGDEALMRAQNTLDLEQAVITQVTTQLVRSYQMPPASIGLPRDNWVSPPQTGWTPLSHQIQWNTTTIATNTTNQVFTYAINSPSYTISGGNLVWGNAYGQFMTPAYVQPLMTDEERARYQAEYAAQQAKWETERKLAEAARKEAEEAAEHLVKDLVGPVGYAEYLRQGFIEIDSKDRAGVVYRIKKDAIDLFERKDGKIIDLRQWLCVHPKADYTGQYPVGDQVATRILLAKFDEKSLWSVANLHDKKAA